MKLEVIQVKFPEPITVQTNQILQIKFAQDLITGEISSVQTRILSNGAGPEPMNDRPVEEIYILGTFDNVNRFNFIDSNNEVQVIQVPINAVHVINMTFGSDAKPSIYQRAIPAQGCYAPENRLWMVSYHGLQFTINEANIYKPQFDFDTKEGESIHQIGDIRSEAKIRLDEPTIVDPDSRRVEFATGAQRSAAVEHLRYDLIHPIFAQALAEVLAEGAEKYGAHNWELGFPIQTLFNHLFGHLWDYLAGDRSEDHLGHAACNIMFLVVEARLRENEHAGHLRLPNCQLSPEMIENIKKFQAEKKEQRYGRADAILSIQKEMVRLYRIGVLHHCPGCQLPVKELGRLYFSDRAYSTLREALEQAGNRIDESDNIVDLEMKSK